MIYIIFLAVLQGFTEFLPISSSGHLELLKNIPFIARMHSSGWQNISENFFNLLLHFGTLMAVTLFYRKDIIKIVKGFFSYLPKLFSSDENRQADEQNKAYFFYALYIVAATLMLFPVALFEHSLDSFLREGKDVAVRPSVLALIFIANGIILMSTWLINRSYKKRGMNQEKKLNFTAVILIGLAQMVAVLPGISRSGITISTAIFLGIEKEESARFSLLLSIPAVLGGLILELKDVTISAATFPVTETFLGIFLSFIVGLLSIKILVQMVKKRLLYQFGIYTFLLGIIIFFVLGIQ